MGDKCWIRFIFEFREKVFQGFFDKGRADTYLPSLSK
jgi:hypothetical protein